MPSFTLGAQDLADSSARLTYRFQNPSKSAVELAMAGLPTLDGKLVSVDLQRGDTVAEITGRVSDSTWLLNPGVQGEANAEKIDFGPIRAYLDGDPRFRVLVRPSTCSGCGGMVDAVFLRFKDSGYLVGRPRKVKD